MMSMGLLIIYLLKWDLLQNPSPPYHCGCMENDPFYGLAAFGRPANVAPRML